MKDLQGDDFTAGNTIVACAEHYAAYGAAIGGRDYNSADMSDPTLREIYYFRFHAAVRAGLGTLMTAFCSLNGLPATANDFLIVNFKRRVEN